MNSPPKTDMLFLPKCCRPSLARVNARVRVDGDGRLGAPSHVLILQVHPLLRLHFPLEQPLLVLLCDIFHVGLRASEEGPDVDATLSSFEKEGFRPRFPRNIERHGWDDLLRRRSRPQKIFCKTRRVGSTQFAR